MRTIITADQRALPGAAVTDSVVLCFSKHQANYTEAKSDWLCAGRAEIYYRVPLGCAAASEQSAVPHEFDLHQLLAEERINDTSVSIRQDSLPRFI
jgi:hypothetical protein